MEKYSMIKQAALLILLGALANTCIASDFQNWTEEITCGKVQYKLTSLCKPAKPGDDVALNECKSQTLEIANQATSRKAKLPELNKQTVAAIKSADAEINEFFVIKWGCGSGGGSNVLVLNYSAGYGNYEGVDSTSAYDDSGMLIEKLAGSKYSLAVKDAQLHTKSVHSIIPQ